MSDRYAPHHDPESKLIARIDQHDQTIATWKVNHPAHGTVFEWVRTWHDADGVVVGEAYSNENFSDAASALVAGLFANLTSDDVHEPTE